MQLILAIDGDPRRSEQLAALVRTARLTVDLVQATSAGEGLHALRDRVPDLILTSPLLSPFDEGVLDEYLRDLGSAGAHVQTVRIPMLSAAQKKKSSAKRLFGLGRKKPQTSSAATDGCDPKIFADEIAQYLTRSAEQRATATKQTPPAETWTETAEIRTGTAASFAAADELVPQALIEDFSAPELAYVETYVQTYVEPVAAPQPEPVFAAPMEERETVVEAEMLVEVAPFVEAETFVEPQTFVEPEIFVEAEAFIEPERFVEAAAFVEREPFVAPQPIVEPEPIIEPKTIVAAAPSEPAVAARPVVPAAGTSPSFEAALAAIRAAWVKPEAKKDEPMPPKGAVSSRPRSLGAGSGDVDLTTAIDTLDDVAGIDRQPPAADGESSPAESKTPAPRHQADSAKKGQQKGRGRKTRGADGRDEWGVFDPNQCGFSALVNKLDEVTDDDVVAGRATTIVR